MEIPTSKVGNDTSEMIIRKRKEMDFPDSNRKKVVYTQDKEDIAAIMWGFFFIVKREAIEDILDDRDALEEYLKTLGEGFHRLGLKYCFAITEPYGADFYKIKGRIHFGISKLIKRKVEKLLPYGNIHRVPKHEFSSFDLSYKVAEPIIIGNVPPTHLATLRCRTYIDPFIGSKDEIGGYMGLFFDGYLFFILLTNLAMVV